MGSKRLAGLPPTRCLQSPGVPGLSGQHRPSSTEWDEILAKDRIGLGLLRAAERFRRIKHHGELGTLVTALGNVTTAERAA